MNSAWYSEINYIQAYWFTSQIVNSDPSLPKSTGQDVIFRKKKIDEMYYNYGLIVKI